MSFIYILCPFNGILKNNNQYSFNDRFMLNKILLITALMCNLLLQAEEDGAYINYFRRANQAELLIADSSLFAALSIYKDLFDDYPHCFYKELHNASLCAIQTNQYDDALKFCKDLVRHGYELNFFESPAFDEFRNNETVWDTFLSVYPELRTSYEKSIDQSLRDKYLSLYEIDQQVASSRDNRRYQDSIFYCLAVSLSNLIKNYGYPHWMIHSDTINMKLYAMMRHYCGLENRIKVSEEMQKDTLYIGMDKLNDIRQIATQALNDGWLLPENYVGITTYSDLSNLYGTVAVKINFEEERVTPFLKAPPEERDEINKRREKIGLLPVNELSQELINSTWYKDYPFKKIKEAWMKCDSCSTAKQYSKIASDLALEVRNSIEEKNKLFLINEPDDINNIYLYFNTKDLNNMKDIYNHLKALQSEKQE
jgi:hypothetical protein